MLKIKESYADFDVKPKFEVTDNAFKITLPNTNYSQTIPNENRHVTGKSADVMATREDRIRNLCKEKGSITRKDVETVLQVSQTTAILILKNMIRRGLLKQFGKGKYIKYQLK